MSEVQVQSLAGRRVVDVRGRVAGRIQSIQAERAGPRCEVVEYGLGTAALLERLGIFSARAIGIGVSRIKRVPWHQLDLSDPEHPRLRCTIEELEAMQETLAARDEG